MGKLIIHQGNRLEALATQLASALAAPLASPIDQELVVVQGRGMALWLSMQLCREQGIWANAEFVYPRRLVERLFQTVITDAELLNGQARYRREQVLWAVLALLPRLLHEPSFASLLRYVGTDPDQSRLFDLAEQIAHTFDEYLTYRPEVLRTWEIETANATLQADLFDRSRSAPHLNWQAPLWRALTQLLGPAHIPHLEQLFHKALKAKKRPANLPERVSVFALGNLPPLYVRVLLALSKHCDVNVFRLSPARALTGSTPASGALKTDLVTAWGQMGREAEHVWQQEQRALAVSASYVDQFAPSPNPSLLAKLQNAILLGEPAPQVAQHSSAEPQPDASLSVHSCHSMLREVEVLHDQLLNLVAQGCTPEEILVMMPSVDEYAPLIQAVFDRPHDPARAIPYRISDRKPQGDSTVLEAFLRLLLLAERRVTASEMLDLLGLAPVHARFSIETTDLESIARWVVDSQIRWGVNAAHKERVGLPGEHQNTWRFGLDRLLLGYAVMADDEHTVEGVLPYAEIEGSSGVLLGRFADFTAAVFEILEQLGSALTPTEWHRTLTTALAKLVAETDDNAWQHLQVRAALNLLLEVTQGVNFEQPISLRVVRRWLASHFDAEREARGFLGGGVTFCALVPMRSIPFRVIALLGFQEGAFPRASRRPDFNVLGQPGQGLPADPNRRADDRYLFLESVLSARERLSISYVGQSIRDNSKSAPSIVVTELLEQLGAPPDFIVRHPLQPFSPSYYDSKDARLYSYEQVYLGGASQVNQARHEPPVLFAGPLPDPAGSEQPGPRTLPLRELLDFFKSPNEYLLRQRLQVQLGEDHLEVPDREPVELDGLEAYKVGAPAVALLLAGHTPAEAERLMQATGQLPSGSLGQLEFARSLRSVAPLTELIQAHTQSERRQDYLVDLTLGAWRLHGMLDQLYADGRVVHHFSRLRATHHLRCWVMHLVLCAVGPQGVQPNSVQICRTQGEGAAFARFHPVSRAAELLATLLELLELGRKQPLPLFADASFAFAKSLRDKPDTFAALIKAQKAWNDEHKRNTGLQRVYGAESELTLEGPGVGRVLSGPTFAELAQLVFDPLLDHLSGDSATDFGEDD